MLDVKAGPSCFGTGRIAAMHGSAMPAAKSPTRWKASRPYHTCMTNTADTAHILPRRPPQQANPGSRRLTAPPDSTAPIATGRHATALLDRILTDALAAERSVMMAIKTILADTTMQGALPMTDARALHHVLASHAVELNGAACRFPNCECRPATCPARETPSA